MSLFIEDEVNHIFDFKIEKTADEITRAVLESVDCVHNVEISLLLTDDDSIRKMNKTHLGRDKATDVLSFPMIEFDKPGSFPDVKDKYSTLSNPDSDELVLGDIVISIDTMIRQASDYNHSLKREFAFLLVHGMLHLLGFDHIEEEDRHIMEEKQRLILESVNISRS